MKIQLEGIRTIAARPKARLPFDCAFLALGYEARARHLVEREFLHADRKLAIGFPKNQELSFAANRECFERLGATISIAEDEAIDDLVSETLESLDRPSTRLLRIAVDVSSFSRSRLARIVRCIQRFSTTNALELSMLYSVAKFSAPPLECGPIAYAGPIGPGFAGWPKRPDGPCFGLVGLGHEPDRAMGALEYIQASDAWLFLPQSSISKYDRTSRAANSILLGSVLPDRIINYRVEDPGYCFAMLHGLAQGLRARGMPIVLTFGPKIFAATALLVGLVVPELGVWRVTEGESAPATERIAAGPVHGIQATFPRAT